MTFERMYELLHEQGQMISDDIQGDRRRDVEAGLLEPVDTGFECYVREIDGTLFGYIYMGDCGEWAFRAEGDKIEDDYVMLDRVKALTPYGDEVGGWKSWEEVI